jgi:hypothetical protein
MLTILVISAWKIEVYDAFTGALTKTMTDLESASPNITTDFFTSFQAPPSLNGIHTADTKV